MKKHFWLAVVAAVIQCGTISAKAKQAPDSVYLFSYATLKNDSHNGLHFAWSRDRQRWVSIGNEYSYLKSDYGQWGAQKKMLTPYLFIAKDGLWHCIWSLNINDRVFAHTASADLIDWGRQSYPELKAGANCINPVVSYSSKDKTYVIAYQDKNQKYFQTTTQNFRTYTPAQEISAGRYHNDRISLDLVEGRATGQVHKVAWDVVDKLINAYEVKQYRASLYRENTKQDEERFKDLKKLEVNVKFEPQKAKSISDMLLGVFFEDINYAADGGLYAELVQNRDFEYQPGDKLGRDPSWNSTYAWTLKGEHTTFNIDSTAPIHPNNPHYAVLNTTTPGAILTNEGFDGIPVKKGEAYNFSVFAKRIKGTAGEVEVSLVDDQQGVLAQSVLNISSANWQKLNAKLTATAGSDHAVLQVKPLSSGILGLDMISLFPQNTFKGHPNGLRADLAQTIADIHPRFVRFPGGCVAHGDGLANIYRWKNTVGPLEARKPQRNLWGYHQSVGLGYFEYFQFCEDIGAEPVPVLAAGVPCQNSGNGGAGQQGGLPMDQMGAYVQDIIDLVEYANGPVTSKWGKLRAEAGHPEPFHLKYIGVGNEDLISDVFEPRFTMIFNALKKAHPEITVIGTVGPFSEGTDYEQGWKLADKLHVPVVDEHYYQPPGWFVHNQNFYDSYDRSKSKVYLGEYAAHLPGRPSNLEVALTEALYLTSLERNGDVVHMASYAPLLAREKHTQWTPDLIYFNGTEIKPTVSYYVQQLYGENAGNEYIPTAIDFSDTRDPVVKRVGVSVVKDTKTNDLIVKMVNLLPVSVKTSLDCGDLKIAHQKLVKTVLQGNPADKTPRPEQSEITLGDQPVVELPAYSFTVLRVKM
jgi:alpha-L-arabinofuranosidase